MAVVWVGFGWGQAVFDPEGCSGRVELVRIGRSPFAQAEEAIRELLSVARRERALAEGHGHACSREIAQRVGITSQLTPRSWGLGLLDFTYQTVPNNNLMLLYNTL
jgi:hypothetical protein